MPWTAALLSLVVWSLRAGAAERFCIAERRPEYDPVKRCLLGN
jgi:hypothetical protein